MTEALVKAVQKGDEDTVRRLLTEGADPSALNKKGCETRTSRAAAEAEAARAAEEQRQ